MPRSTACLRVWPQPLQTARALLLSQMPGWTFTTYLVVSRCETGSEGSVPVAKGGGNMGSGELQTAMPTEPACCHTSHLLPPFSLDRSNDLRRFPFDRL